MVGIQSGKGQQAGIGASPEQSGYHGSSPQHVDILPLGPTVPSTHVRGPSLARGRILGSASVSSTSPQSQASSRTVSPRTFGNNNETRSRSNTPTPGSQPLERCRSGNQGHHRQTSVALATSQRPRKNSLANTATLRNTQISSHTHGGLAADGMSFASPPLEFYDLRSAQSTTSVNTMLSNSYSSTSPLANERDLAEDEKSSAARTTVAGAQKVERNSSVKPRRDHGRSQSKPLTEQRSVGEYALHHLFNSFVGKADSKINLCVISIPESTGRVEDICGVGLDPDFDALISALGHISRAKPKHLVDTIMYWRKAKSEDLQLAQAKWNALKSSPANRPLPRRPNESGNYVPDNAAQDDHLGSDYSTVQDSVIQAERRLSLSIYLICRVLMEVYQQSDLESITAVLDDKLEDLIFEQLLRLDPDKVATSPFHRANWTIFGQLLGVMSSVNFSNVARRFIRVLQIVQDEVDPKGITQHEPEMRVELVVRAMSHMTIRAKPESQWRESCDFMYTLAKFFLTSHGQPIKYAYCQILATLTLPVAASSSLQLHSVKWKDFLGLLNTRLTQMLTKPRHWLEAFPLHNLVLCISPPDIFSAHWMSVIHNLQPKLKDRVTRGPALQAICRLVWTYLHRSTESVALRKLEDIIKIVLPTGKRTYLSTDPSFSEPIIEFIRLIGHFSHDFCFKMIVFPLLNSDLFAPGKEVRIEQLEPERTVIGIRAFLAVVGDQENPGQGPPSFPYFGAESRLPESSATTGASYLTQPTQTLGSTGDRSTHRLSKPLVISRLDDVAKQYYNTFCEILGTITLICDNTFGGQATLDEKFGSVPTPKTPITESFNFGRKDEHISAQEQRQGFYELLHEAVRALPRCLSSQIPFNSLINLLCTGTAHVQTSIASSSADSLKAIARQSHAQPVTIGFARFIFNFDARYSTMSDEGLLGPGHIENTLQLYLELLGIWIDEIKQRTKTVVVESPVDNPSMGRGLGLDLTSVTAAVEDVESHGFFFLCSQSRRVRAFAISVLRLVKEFDAVLGCADASRIIQILQGDMLVILNPEDDRLTLAEKSRLQQGKRKSTPQNTLIELCSSDVSYDSTLWSKVFPGLVRQCFHLCPVAITLGRQLVCARLDQMMDQLKGLGEATPRATQASPLDRSIGRQFGNHVPDVFVEQWKSYLIMACTTMTNTGGQTQSQLANTQHIRSKSKNPQRGEKLSSARALFSEIIPLLSASQASVRDAVVIALGSINSVLYRTLLESLQYAVTTCNEEAKVRVGTHQRTMSSSRRNRRTEHLRTEVTYVYKLTSRFLREEHVLRDEWIMGNLIKYADDLRIFLSDAEVQNDWEFQTLRRHYCGLLEEVFEGVNRAQEASRLMPFDARKAAFALMEDWCGCSPDQTQITLREDSMRQFALNQGPDASNVTAAIEIQKRDLRMAALSAMASLCAGPISVIADRVTLSFDVRRMLEWIDQIFGTISDKMHVIGRRALKNLIIHNMSYPNLLERAIDECMILDRPKALESYFEVVSGVLCEHVDYPLPFWRILSTLLLTLGNDEHSIRIKSARLLRTLEDRQQKRSRLQDFDISISDRTKAVYKLAQFEISKRLAKQHPELAFYVFSQFSLQFKVTRADYQRNMIAAILPWVQVLELDQDSNGDPTQQTFMVLANLLEITTRSSNVLHNEVQALWQALATGPHGGNVQLVLDFVIALCIERKEQSFVDYAKQIVVFLSSTPAGQKVVDFLLLQITPRNMAPTEKPKCKALQDVLGLPYVADLGETLPIGNKQAGFSLGQLSLILLVDLMVAPVKLSQDGVPVLLQVCTVLWDHYTPLVQEQAREMLVHLIHELVISNIEDNSSDLKDAIEDFVEAIRQSKPDVVWTYHQVGRKDDEDEGRHVPPSMLYLTRKVIELFALTYRDIDGMWAKTTLSWATSCSVRHLACRSFQIFRCMLATLDQSMLADMLARLSNTIADETTEVQGFAMEILITIKTIIGALDAENLLRFPQLFWVTAACLNTVNEREFIETLDMLDVLLSKGNLNDPLLVKLLSEAKPHNWAGNFEGILPLVYKGLKSEDSLSKTLGIIIKTAPLSDNDLLGSEGRILFGVLAHLPSFLNLSSGDQKDVGVYENARVLSSVADTEGFTGISLVLNAFANARYHDSNEFLTQIMSSIKQEFFPAFKAKSLIFLMGLLANRLPWFKLRTMEILCMVIPEVDMRSPELAGHGPDLISPLLRLLQTEYCPQALELMDLIMTMNATPMDKHHLRMSMIMSGSKTVRKEYERTQSLYGIPEQTGWSIPMPAIHSNVTRANVHAVFYTCASLSASQAEPVVTPEIEFDREEEHQNSYFPMERADTMQSEDTRVENGLDHSNLDQHGGDLVSKLDSLDDFFDDDDESYDHFHSGSYSDSTITAYGSDTDGGAKTYDQQTVPILRKAFARNASMSSLPNSYPDRTPSNPSIMTPGAFSAKPSVPTPVPRPLHSRSVTSPSKPVIRYNDFSLDQEAEEIFSEDERSTGRHIPTVFNTMVQRAKSLTTKKLPLPTGGAGIEIKQGDLLRGQNRFRSKSQVPGSPEVPKVPEAYLMSNRALEH